MPGWHDRLDRSWRIAVYALVALGFLYASRQLTVPFIAGDDWTFLIPASQQGGTGLPWTNTLAEGRWVNYFWYLASVHLTAESANVLFTLAYIAMAGVVAALVSTRRWFPLCALALFFSPMFSELSFWPTGMFVATALCGIACLMLWRTSGRYTAVAVLVVATILLVMAYPPLALIVLLAALITQKQPTPITSGVLILAFLLAFLASVLAAYGLNAIFHGYFGVRVAAWRHPHPLRSFGDLVFNARLAAGNWVHLAREYRIAIACLVVAGVLALRARPSRARAAVVLVGLAVCWCVAVGIDVIAGVPAPGRSIVWLWVGACALCTLIAIQRSSTHQRLGAALLVILIWTGAASSWANYRHYRPIVAWEHRVGTALSAVPLDAKRAPVILAGSFDGIPYVGSMAGGHWPQPVLSWIAWKRFGVSLRMCDYTACRDTTQYMRDRRITEPAILRLRGQTILALNPYPATQILRNYPDAQQEQALHLSYPIFVRYTANMVRITPFFPGTHDRPLSIALPNRRNGYVSRPQTSSCAFPLAYQVTDESGHLLETGQLSPTSPTTFDKSAAGGTFTLVTIQMANGATNNYGCNFVISAAP